MAAPPEPARLPVADLERIFRESHAAVFRAAYRITGNASDAEDALQTVFLRLLKRDAAADAVENMPSFLRRAAVNAALDIVRVAAECPEYSARRAGARAGRIRRIAGRTACRPRAKFAIGCAARWRG